MYISESKKTIRILRVCFQRPGSCQHSSSSLWWSTLALHLFSFIKTINCYFAQKLPFFLFSKGFILARHKIWYICLFMKNLIGSKFGYSSFSRGLIIDKAQNLSIYLLLKGFVNNWKKIGSFFGPRSNHSLPMSLTSLLTEDLVET